MGTTSQYKGYTVPTVNADSGTWGNELNTTLSLIDQNLGGTVPITVTNSSATNVGGITLTSSQIAMSGYVFTGVLGQNYTVTFPGGQPVSGMRWFYNGTTQASGGPYTLKVVCSNTPGNAITIPVSPSDANSQTYASNIMCDGTNVYAVGSGGGAQGAVNTVAGGGTGQSSLTQGSVLVGTGTSPVTLVAPGAAGTVLTSVGPGLAPAFQAIGSTGTPVSLLNTVNMAGSATVVDTTSLGAGYTTYLIICTGVTGSAGAVNLQFSQNGGTSYVTTSYLNAYSTIQGTTFAVGAANTGGIPLSGGINLPASATAFNMLFYIYSPASTSTTKVASWSSGGQTNSGNPATVSGHGWLGGATQLTAVTAFRLIISTGAFSAGTMRVYGVP